MTINITAALEQMNQAMERTYTIQESGMLFTLTMPSGGKYPPVDGQAMVERLVTLRIAAEGRVR